MRILVVAIFLLTYKLHCAQTPTVSDPTPFLNKHTYLKSLVIPDSVPEATLIGFGVHYVFVPKPIAFATNGTHITLSLNLARFFSKKFHLGVCVDYKPIPSIYQNPFTSNFVQDFNANFIGSYDTPSDSAKANIVKSAINAQSSNRFSGNTLSGWGITFSPFPKKFGSILVQIKQGNRFFLIDGVHGNPFLSNRDLNYVSFTLKNNYSFELSIKPFTLLNNENRNLHLFKDAHKFLSVSFYYERLNLSKATFDGMKMEQIVRRNFIEKYEYIADLGLKVGYNIY